MEKKKDLRVIKTQKTLFNTLLMLLKDKPFEDIKVSDICNEALINRSTFYAHYNDKYELLVDLINNLKDSLEKALDTNKNIINTKEYYMEMIKILLNHLDNERDTYYPILLNNRNSVVLDILLDVIDKDIEKKFHSNNLNGNVPKEIVAKFYLGAVVSIGIEWLRNNKKYTEEEIFNYLNVLIPDNINEL